ncbi:MAG: hypothetical protein H0T80_06260 [Betaproteobacteria bacterium]|nr:hypothetical protein [Betaproteobacteria bacterium]
MLLDSFGTATVPRAFASTIRNESFACRLIPTRRRTIFRLVSSEKVGDDAGRAGKQELGVIVPLTKSGDNDWAVLAGAKFTDAQYAAFQAGDFVRQRAQRCQEGRRNPEPAQALTRTSAAGRRRHPKGFPHGDF